MSVFTVFVLLIASLAPLALSGEGGTGGEENSSFQGGPLGSEGPIGSSSGGFIVPVTPRTDFDSSYTAIHNVQELSNIRKDLSGNYYLANNIDFSKDSSGYDNGGVMIPLIVSVLDADESLTAFLTVLLTDILSMTGADDGLLAELLADYELLADFFTKLGADDDYLEILLAFIREFTLLKVTIGTQKDTLSGPSVWFGGSNYSDLTAGTAELVMSRLSDPTQTLIMSGILNSESFAFSLEVDTSVPGILFDGSFDSNGNFDPIGSFDSPFTGVFDGNGYTISGMHTAVYSIDSIGGYSGLFGCVGDIDGTEAEVKNVGMINGSSVTCLLGGSEPQGTAGGIAGLAIYSTITNCYNTGSVASSVSSLPSSSSSSSSSYPPTCAAGGITGLAHNSTITNCYNTGSVTASLSPNIGDGASAGGIAGIHMGEEIAYCYNTGPVLASAYSSSYSSLTYTTVEASAGGIVGTTGTDAIVDCCNTGSVTAVVYSKSLSSVASAGGIAANGGADVSNCYNTGPVSASSELSSSYNTYASSVVIIGGIVGNMYYGTISNCYNTGPVSVSSSSYYNIMCLAGGIAAGAEYIINCYNTGSVSISTETYSGETTCIAGGIAGGAGYITNCYYLAGTLNVNGDPADGIALVHWDVSEDVTVVIDGGSGAVTNPVRKIGTGPAPDQRSSAKTSGEMQPSLTNARNNNSIYFTGTTALSGGENNLAGWDFNTIWTIGPDVNGGYPTLRSAPDPPTSDTEGPTPPPSSPPSSSSSPQSPSSDDDGFTLDPAIVVLMAVIAIAGIGMAMLLLKRR